MEIAQSIFHPLRGNREIGEAYEPANNAIPAAASANYKESFATTVFKSDHDGEIGALRLNNILNYSAFGTFPRAKNRPGMKTISSVRRTGAMNSGST